MSAKQLRKEFPPIPSLYELLFEGEVKRRHKSYFEEVTVKLGDAGKGEISVDFMSREEIPVGVYINAPRRLKFITGIGREEADFVDVFDGSYLGVCLILIACFALLLRHVRRRLRQPAVLHP